VGDVNDRVRPDKATPGPFVLLEILDGARVERLRASRLAHRRNERIGHVQSGDYVLPRRCRMASVRAHPHAVGNARSACTTEQAA